MSRLSSIRKARLKLTALETREVPAVFTVTNLLDSGPGTLRAAIGAANAAPGADLVRFQLPAVTTVIPQITLTTGEIAITDGLTINGILTNTTGTVNSGPMIQISGNNASRIFNVHGAGTFGVTLNGLSLKSGLASSSGGAIVSLGHSLQLRHCTIMGSSASGSGGAIAMMSASTTISNAQSALTLDHCTIANNRAEHGGAISTAGRVHTGVSFTSIMHNQASQRGGGLAIGAGGRLLINSSTLANNVAAVAGGGLQFVGMTNNSAPTSTALDRVVEVRNSTLSGNRAGQTGGGMQLVSFAPGTAAYIANSTLTANVAGANISTTSNFGAGGGIHVVGSSIATSLGVVQLVSSVVSRNHAFSGPEIFSPGSVIASHSALGSTNGIGNFVNGGFNLAIGVNPKLGPLQNNGGPTLTHMPAFDSPLINRGSNPLNLLHDQRGHPHARIVGIRADIGAVERPAISTSPTTASSVTANSGATTAFQDSQDKESTLEALSAVAQRSKTGVVERGEF
jgi:hypothetical protein